MVIQPDFLFLEGTGRVGQRLSMTGKWLFDFQHSFEGNSGVGGDGGVDLDAVDDFTIEKILESAEQVARIHSVHGGAKTLNQRKRLNVLVGMELGKASDEIDLGADGPTGAGRSCLNGFDDLSS